MPITAGSVKDVKTAAGTDGIPTECNVISLGSGEEVSLIKNDKGFFFKVDDHVLYDSDAHQIEGVLSKLAAESWMDSSQSTKKW